MRTLYTLAWYVLSPAVAAWALIRGGGIQGLRERLGLGQGAVPGGIWVHGASVGEIQAALPLVEALRVLYPDLPVTVTAFTPTGRDHARRQAPPGIRCLLLPLDFPGATRRFLERTRPRLGVIVETELWPNLYAACRAAEVPLVVVSARITESAARSYARARPIMTEMFAVPTVISAQTDTDALRLEELGADPTRVTVGGNLKFDFRLPDGIDLRVAALREELRVGDRRVWIAASTHDGEEAAALDAHRVVLAADPRALLVLAPRHPGRADGIAARLRQRRFRFARRSTGDAAGADTQVFLLDTLGELAVFYGLADVAFIGGTLVDIGGHNLLEPAAFGIPMLCGPHVHAIARMHALMRDAGAVGQVGDGKELGTRVTRLMKDDAQRARMGGAARGVLERNRGAVERAVRLIDGVLWGQGKP